MLCTFFLLTVLSFNSVVSQSTSQEIVYVSSEFGIDSSNCSQTTPCASLHGALHSLSNTSKSGLIKMYPGYYTGEKNINVQFPTITIFITIVEEIGTVQFDCQNEFNSTGFSGITNLELYGIKITNCTTGIHYNPIKSSQSLNLISSEINSCNIGINHNGGNLQMVSSRIVNCTILPDNSNSGKGIYIQPLFNTQKINEITITSSFIENTISHAIYICLTETNEILLNIDKTMFIQFGGNYISGIHGGIISNSEFLGFQSNQEISNFLEIENGNWNFYQLSLQGILSGNCKSAISLSEIDSIHLNDVNIYSCSNGIEFYNSNIKYENSQIIGINYGFHGDFNYNDKNYSKIEINNVIFNTLSDSININCNNDNIPFDNENQFPQISIENSFFNQTGKVFIACPSFGNILNSSFIDILHPRSIQISGDGFWFFNQLEFVNSNFSGGAVEIHKINDVNACFNDCSFIGNFADNGGAIYFDGNSLNLTNCYFSDNVATNGGGIYLKNSDCVLQSNVSFISNRADFGSAIYCTSGSRLMVDDDDILSLDSNFSDSGNDIECTIVSSSSFGFMWMYSFILIIICAIVIVVGVFVLIRRRRIRNNIEFVNDEEQNESDIEMDEFDEDTL